MSDKDKELGVSSSQNFRHIQFKRPSALNALSLEMIRVLDQSLMNFEDDDSAIVFVEGTGGKAFCAGGDVVSVYKHGLSWQAGLCPIEIPLMFFKEEYQLNHKLYKFSKPYIAYLNGIVMGGGFGVSAPGELMVTNEDTLFAMPEVHIGLFPDVGSMYYLHQLKGALGLYVVLTGVRLKAEDMHVLGLAEYHIPKSGAVELKKSLVELSLDADAASVKAALKSFHQKPKEDSKLEGHIENIHHIFSLPNVESILKALEDVADEWGAEALALMKSASPTSLEITFRHWQKTKGKTFKQVVEQDFALVQWTLKGQDFYMGVKEQLIEKTKRPVWQPKSLKDISESDINAYFESGTQPLF